MAITETWMTENDPSEEFQINGYQPIVSNPREKLNGDQAQLHFISKKE